MNIMFNSFLNTFLRLFYSSFPLKELKIKSKNTSWSSSGIKNSCKHKRDLYLLCHNGTNITLKNHYRQYCKTLKDVIKEAKNSIIINKSNSSNKIKTIWDITKSVTGRSTKIDTIQELNIKGNVISNSQGIDL